MKEMARLAKDRDVNRKMTLALKGSRQSLDRIEVPQYEWYYTAGRMTLPRIPGEISVAYFQAAFKAVSKKTTLLPSGLHYSIWRVLARDNSLAKWLSIMMSLPFMYGFVSEQWIQEVNVIIEKSEMSGRYTSCKSLGSSRLTST